MAEEQKRWRNRSSPALAFAIWFFGWLFTIGYVGMVWWQIILAIVVWPFYLGRALS